LKREVFSDLYMTVDEPTELVFKVAVAKLRGPKVKDNLKITLNGKKLKYHEVITATGTRMQVVPAGVGEVEMHYEAVVKGTFDPVPVSAAEVSEYLAPSRFVDSDRITAIANQHFGQIDNARELLDSVTTWVHNELTYVAGSSGPETSASETLAGRQGVCRDYAHVTAALLRARGVAARFVAVYAPGLSPMDFHAVAEANIDGKWLVADSTKLAPRQSLVRIATGRDATDTAFMANNGGYVTLNGTSITAVSDGDLPLDDHTGLIQLR
jgi:transglutaminase-like putative cysteine protease